MIKQPVEIRAPLTCLPVGLISWYSYGGLSVALMTPWIALVGGERPRIKTAWYGRYDPESRFWAGGDFVLNIPYEGCLQEIQEVMSRGKLCLKAETDLHQTCASGVAVVAPLLLGCAVQIECKAGKLIDAGFDVELCGDVVRLHREKDIIDPVDIVDLCALNPLSPRGSF